MASFFRDSTFTPCEKSSSAVDLRLVLHLDVDGLVLLQTAVLMRPLVGVASSAVHTFILLKH